MSTRSPIIWAASVVVLLTTCAVAQEPAEDGPFDRYRELLRTRFVSGGRISDVRWSSAGDVVTFDRDGERHRFDLERRVIEPATEEDDEETTAGSSGTARGRRPGRGRQRDRETSPDGAWIAVCEDWNVFVESAEGGERFAITDGGTRKLRYGKASWVYGEELAQRTAMWWSPDSRWLVFYEFDEREVPDYFITGGLTDLRTEVLREGYPKPGDPNPIAGLMVFDMLDQTTSRIDATNGEEWYVFNVQFTPDGDMLLFSRTNRHQSVLQVVAAELESGTTYVVVEERQETWQKNRPTMRFLEDGHRFVWETERTGWAQYELRDLDGSLLATLSETGSPVRSIVSIDEDAGWLYYTAANGGHPLSRQLNRVRLDGTERARLTSGELSHAGFDVAPDHRWFIARRQSVTHPPETVLFSAHGEEIGVLAESDVSVLDELGAEPAEMFTYTAADGVTELHGILYKPTDFEPELEYPLIVDVYGGPLSRGVDQSFSPPVRAEGALGFLVAKLENRGTVGRGKAFEAATYLQLGTVDLDDQVAGVRALTARPYVDGERVGIFGHSYGGYMAALAILRHPDVYHAAVAGAPVTDWRNYDTIYTERFMRTPQENADGYDAGSCLTYAEQLRGHLLLMHGMVDDNVHPTNAWQLIDKLQRAGKRFEMMMFPNGGHGLGTGSRSRRMEFLHEHLVESAASE